MKTTLRFLLLIAFFLKGLTVLSIDIKAQKSEDAIVDSLKVRLVKQRLFFPQEKIYAQINKPYYIAGETIWFRAHLVDAMAHTPDTMSRYVYAELINPYDSIVSRVKIRPQEGAYYGHIDLDEDVAGGDYQLRYYTKFMSNLDENYFFKRKISIGDPLSALYRIEAEFNYEDSRKKKIEVDLRIINIENKHSIDPENISVVDYNGRNRKIKVDEDSVFRFSIPTPSEEVNRSLYLEYTYLNRTHKQFIPIIIENSDFHVDFFPEGGNVVDGAYNRVAFKAINENGLGENITGIVINQNNDTIWNFQSEHLGMGYFLLNNLNSQELRAICTNSKGVQKTFDLSLKVNGKISLHSAWRKDRLLVSLSKAENFVIPDSLYLVIHSRGFPLSVQKWSNKADFISIDKQDLPTGVVHILLLDAQFNPISERLMFNLNREDIIRSKFIHDKPLYKKREEVKASIDLLDEENNPLFADLSVTVTDDKDVKQDSCINILSSILLTSDLTGYIENPAYYFEKENTETIKNLDILMMTQGWRRYNVTKMLKGDTEIPSIPRERSLEISGTVKGGFLMNKGGADYPVTIICTKYRLFGQGVTGDKGLFRFTGFELPDSTKYVIQGQTKKHGSRVELLIDPEMFPQSIKQLPPSYILKNDVFENYLEKADQQYVMENGMRIINLKGVEVTAKQKPKRENQSRYSSPFNTVISAEKIEESFALDIYHLLMTSGIAGVTVSGTDVRIRNNPGPPLFLVDDIEVQSDELGFISVTDIADVEIAKGPEAAIFGFRGANGAIMITTKRGGGIQSPKLSFNIKEVTPLGYQITKEFYSPKYETQEQRADPKPDLRSNIYWNPSVQTDEKGKAEIRFYTADSPSTYSVIFEGITTDGRIVHAVEKINRLDQ